MPKKPKEPPRLMLCRVVSSPVRVEDCKYRLEPMAAVELVRVWALTGKRKGNP